MTMLGPGGSSCCAWHRTNCIGYVTLDLDKVDRSVHSKELEASYAQMAIWQPAVSSHPQWWPWHNRLQPPVVAVRPSFRRGTVRQALQLLQHRPRAISAHLHSKQPFSHDPQADLEVIALDCEGVQLERSISGFPDMTWDEQSLARYTPA